METVNGEWFMKGCSPEAPYCLHSAQDLEALVSRIGFLPLFSNAISGFSVEERTPASKWWTGDPLTDPWEWRIQLASCPGLAYGKFFDRKAGYLSAEWFPYLANYRRNGYDFDALWDEGFASYRWNKIYQALEPDEAARGKALFTCELKEQAGFGKGGEKNFEGVLTDLQMRTYLILGDFRQRLNRSGKPYGWHLALVETPETKWGYEAVTAAYRETPSASLEKIEACIRKNFPDATASQVRMMIGLKGIPNAD